MNGIYIFKALILGTFGAGGFYFVMAFVFHYFPMPAFFYLRERAVSETVKRYKKEGDLPHLLWRIARVTMIFLMLLAWWGIFAIFAYGLYTQIPTYIPTTEDNFWIYYGIAITIPVLWVFYRFVRFIFPSKEKGTAKATVATILREDQAVMAKK
jgi:hypothetical protein